MTKKRVDLLLLEQKWADTRQQAKQLILNGFVFRDGQRLDKPGIKIDAATPLHVKGDMLSYVGRGGLKLEKALQTFAVNLRNSVMLDVGSSTGGFTDCALQHGARLCYAIDTGYNQLATKLRDDDRVVVMEQTNFRYVTPDMIQNSRPDFAAIDVSFISLRLILPVLKQLLQPDSDVIVLIKPQFEAGRAQVGKKGIVRDKKTHIDVLDRITTFAAKEGYQTLNLTYSPVTGGNGNIELLAHLGWQKDQPHMAISSEAVVEKAHAELRTNTTT